LRVHSRIAYRVGYSIALKIAHKMRQFRELGVRVHKNPGKVDLLQKAQPRPKEGMEKANRPAGGQRHVSKGRRDKDIFGTSYADTNIRGVQVRGLSIRGRARN
jgi:hypothetical protein